MWRLVMVAAATASVLLGGSVMARVQTGSAEPPWQAFFAAAGADRQQAQAALTEITARWRDSYAAMIVDIVRFLPSPRSNRASDDDPALNVDDADDEQRADPRAGRGEFPPIVRSPPGADTRRRLTSFLERQTRQRFGDDLRAWRKWMWELPDHPHPDYASFKAELYSRIDPEFRAFFPPRVKSRFVSTKSTGAV